MVSVSKFLAGANITVQKLNTGSVSKFDLALDEVRITDFLSDKVYHPTTNPGGVISNFAFQTSMIEEIMDS